LVPTSRRATAEEIDGLRILEWDVLVTLGELVAVPAFMHVLAFEAYTVGGADYDDSYSSLSYAGEQPSEELHVADDLTPQLRRLVMTDLVPALNEMAHRPFLRRMGRYGFQSAVDLCRQENEQIFVSDPDGNLIAGAFARRDFQYAGGYCWALPFRSRRPQEWFALALRDWHEKTPSRVPTEPEWQTRPEWSSAAQRAASQALVTFETQRVEAERRLNEIEAELRSAVTLASASAASGIQRLLTAQDEPLVDAVADALEALGFGVTPMDPTRAPGQPKMEDLRAANPDDPSWTNITEVKGYSGGARVGDFLKIARHATHFLREETSLPASRWYVVNQFLEEDPDSRRLVLAGSEQDLAIFAEDGGLVVDTRELFRLVRMVEADQLTAAQARTSLCGASGRYTAPQAPRA
jgi:hypothetical protein